MQCRLVVFTSCWVAFHSGSAAPVDRVRTRQVKLVGDERHLIERAVRQREDVSQSIHRGAASFVAHPQDAARHRVQTPDSTVNETPQLNFHAKPGSLAQRTGREASLKSWDSKRVWRQACDTHIKKHPDEITCPERCKFLRAEPTRICQFKCVPASACNSDNPLASFANPANRRCEACKVAGCHRCGATRHECAACQDGFLLRNGSCISQYRLYWSLGFAVLGLILLFVVFYIVAIFRRETTPEGIEALEAGLENRRLAKHRDVVHNKQYDLRTNLQKQREAIGADGEPYNEPPIGGVGVMLHFRWQFMVLVWACFCSVLFIITGIIFVARVGSVHRVNSRKSYDACKDNVEQVVFEFDAIEFVYFIATMIMYLVTFIGSLIFAMKQRRTFQYIDCKITTMKDFAMFCSGFPRMKDEGDQPGQRVEERMLKWFKEQRQTEGLDIVGVSLCWDYRYQKEEVTDATMHLFDDEAGQLSEVRRLKAAHEEHRECCDSSMRCVDPIFGIGNFPCAKPPSDEESQAIKQDIKEMLENLESSGCCYVVFRSTPHVHKALDRLKTDPFVYDDKEIFTRAAFCEPETVIWKGFGSSELRFYAGVVAGVFGVILGMLILDIFFYAPYVSYILSYSDVPGMSQGGFVSGTLLGLLISICNVLIYQIIGVVTERCSWTNGDCKDCFYCIKYTLAVFCNTCLDLGTVLILAQGYSVDQAMKMQVAADSTLSSKALAESPNMQKALYVQLVAYIFPSCTLIPFLLEPVGSTLVPYVMGTLFVRSRSDVSHQDAEICLNPPPYDLSRHGDILVNMMLCCVTMVFTYSDLYLLFVYMIISLLVIYAWDHCRVLRFSTRSTFAGNTMDNHMAYMMAMPCGVLALALCFKAYGASHQGFLDELRSQMDGHYGVSPDRYNIYGYLILAFFGHVLIHCLLLTFVVKPLADRDALPEDLENARLMYPLYDEIARKTPANWFTTNPIFCLRSKYIYEHDKNTKSKACCLFYRVGKENMMEKNEELGCFYHSALESDVQDDETGVKSLGVGTTVRQRMKHRASVVGAQVKSGANKFIEGA